MAMPVQVSGSNVGLRRQAQQITGFRCTAVCRGNSLDKTAHSQRQACQLVLLWQQERLGQICTCLTPCTVHIPGAPGLALRGLGDGLFKWCRPCMQQLRLRWKLPHSLHRLCWCATCEGTHRIAEDQGPCCLWEDVQLLQQAFCCGEMWRRIRAVFPAASLAIFL